MLPLPPPPAPPHPHTPRGRYCQLAYPDQTTTIPLERATIPLPWGSFADCQDQLVLWPLDTWEAALPACLVLCPPFISVCSGLFMHTPSLLPCPIYGGCRAPLLFGERLGKGGWREVKASVLSFKEITFSSVPPVSTSYNGDV